ncbi:MAG: hypothetical protein JSU70_19555 [Phycisphaerales bacterium]|nr:MAG: hypothetical protein JSU70_19555 [Phycisphaerales bacterium]
MRQIARAIASSFFEDFKRSSPRKKAAIAACIVVFVLLIWSLLRSDGGPPGLSAEQVGLSPLSVIDDTGTKWELDLITGQPLARIASSGKKPGPPLLIKVDVRQTGRQDVSIGLTIEGQAGERYMAGVIKNGQREPEPKFRIVHELGRELADGRFEYG